MELLRYTAPFDAQEVLTLWQDVFGEYETLLETPQVNGSEKKHNLDIVYVAKEGDILLGTVHATIPKAFPMLGGISAMCTTPAARGKGIGRFLFSAMIEELNRRGVKIQFLGTSNDIAAKLYHSLGFSFLPCSSVMARFTEGDLLHFNRMMYQEAPKSYHIEPACAAMRIPIIPLILHKGPFMILDCNTALINCAYMPQFSCMSLYPRYMELIAKGGASWGVYNEFGVLGAVASIQPTDIGMRADFYCCNSWIDVIPELLAHCEATAGTVHLQIAETDTQKKEMAAACGYYSAQPAVMMVQNLQIPCEIYIKSE